MKNRNSRSAVEREARALVVRLTEDGVPPEARDWFYDCRRGRLHPLKGIDRLATQAARTKKSREYVKELLVGLVAVMVDDAYDDLGVA